MHTANHTQLFQQPLSIIVASTGKFVNKNKLMKQVLNIQVLVIENLCTKCWDSSLIMHDQRLEVHVASNSIALDLG